MAAFSYGEPELFFHGDGHYKFYFQGNVVTRHDHLYVFGKSYYSGDVSGPKIKLRSIAFEEGSVSSSLFLA